MNFQWQVIWSIIKCVLMKPTRKESMLCVVNASVLLLKIFCDLVDVKCGLLVWWRYALVVRNIRIFGQHHRSLTMLYGTIITQRWASRMRKWGHFSSWHDHRDRPSVYQRTIFDCRAGTAFADLRSYLTWKRNVSLMNDFNIAKFNSRDSLDVSEHDDANDGGWLTPYFPLSGRTVLWVRTLMQLILEGL